jgi:hypothetical protein
MITFEKHLEQQKFIPLSRVKMQYKFLQCCRQQHNVCQAIPPHLFRDQKLMMLQSRKKVTNQTKKYFLMLKLEKLFRPLLCVDRLAVHHRLRFVKYHKLIKNSLEITSLPRVLRNFRLISRVHHKMVPQSIKFLSSAKTT